MHCSILNQPQGSIIQALVGVSGPRGQALRNAGQPIPQPVTVSLLIDSGAGGTVIDNAVIAQLGLQPTDSIPIRTPSTGATAHVCNTYDIGLVLPGPLPAKVFSALPVIETPMRNQGIDGLLGRDVLAEGRLIYSGFDGLVMLSF